MDKEEKVIQTQLFDDQATVAEKQLPYPGKKCRHCKFYYKHQYGQMHYCSLQHQRHSRTAYGDKKVKGNADACQFFENVKK